MPLQLPVHKAPVCSEHGRQAVQYLRAFACHGTKMSDRARVLVEQQSHRDTIHLVGVAPGAIVELCGQTLNAAQAHAVQALRGVGRRCLVARACLTEDSSQLREPSRGIVHRA